MMGTQGIHFKPKSDAKKPEGAPVGRKTVILPPAFPKTAQDEVDGYLSQRIRKLQDKLDALPSFNAKLINKYIHEISILQVIQDCMTVSDKRDEAIEKAKALLQFSPPQRWSFNAHKAWDDLKAILKVK